MKAIRIVFSMLVGAMAGWTVGYLTAPRSGKKTRKQLMNEANEMKDALEEAANTKLEEAKTLLNKTITKQAELGKEVIEKVKDKATV